MAERGTAKTRRSDLSKVAEKTAEKGTSEAQMAAEIARLEGELASARARVAELEQKHAEIVNRIDWVIDSLHSLAR